MNKPSEKNHRFVPGPIPADDARFDALMRAWAKAEPVPEPSAKLERTLAHLDALPRREGRRPAFTLRAAAAALALLALVSATALAATLGLARFSPRLFVRRPGDEADAVAVAPRGMAVEDASGLTLLSAEAIDAAFIDGRLTMSVRVTAADPGRPLFWGVYDEGIYRVQQEGSGAPYAAMDALPDGALLVDDMGGGWPSAVYPDGARRGAAECGVTANVEPDGLTLAIQAGADFIVKSDLPDIVRADGRIPVELAFDVWDADEVHQETLVVSVAAPTEEEQALMDAG